MRPKTLGEAERAVPLLIRSESTFAKRSSRTSSVLVVFVARYLSSRGVAMAGRQTCGASLALSIVLHILPVSVPPAEAQMPLGPFVAGVAGHYAGPMVTVRPPDRRRQPRSLPKRPPLHPAPAAGR
jgi:hypothetical protein